MRGEINVLTGVYVAEKKLGFSDMQKSHKFGDRDPA